MKKSLDRFLIAQQNYYHDAYEELKVGKKRSHWMWFIFPQIRGLGYSKMAIYYAIESREEAENYITDPTLGHNLIEISTVLLEIKDNDAKKVMGEPDDRKLQSCMTLFDTVAPEIDVFEKVLKKFFGGERDNRTLEILLSSISEQEKNAYLQKTISALSDEERNLLQTYFEANMSLLGTSQKLFLHKNTVQYKLNHIYQKCGLNPRVFKDAVLLYLALQL